MKKTFCIFLVCLFLCTGVSASELEVTEHMHANYSKALKMSAMPNFNGYCAACVAYQVMAMGISREYIYGNGNEAFGRYGAIARTSGGWYTVSYPSHTRTLKQVLQMQNTGDFGANYYPIILGFNKGTASAAGQRYGHAMMIYAVRAGTVYFTDSTEPAAADNIHSLSIDDFCLRYSDKPDTPEREFVYDGAVVFYRSAPDGAALGISKDRLALWEPVTFSFSSPAATGYSMGVDKDGVRVMTVHTQEPFYTVQFGEPGTYTAYISACNSFGYADSTAVTFTVGMAPCNAFINADKQSAAAGETVTVSYGADYATSYAVGITHPDGTYEVINAGDTAVLQRSFDEPGVYSIFVSCCNSSGYVDTATISLEIN